MRYLLIYEDVILCGPLAKGKTMKSWLPISGTFVASSKEGYSTGAKSFGLTFFLIAISLFFDGCSSKPEWKQYQGGIHIVLDVESKGDLTVDASNTSRIAEIIGRRLDQFGVKDRIVKVYSDRKIAIQLPHSESTGRTVELISKSSTLEFKLVDEEGAIEDALKGNIPPGDIILFEKSVDRQTGAAKKTPFLVKEKTLMTGEFIKDARMTLNSQFHQPYVTIEFTDVGARLFEQITGANVKRRLAIILDNNVYSAPIIQERIAGGIAQIAGRFTTDEAKELSILLKAGAFPAHVKMIQKRELNKEIWLGDTDTQKAD